MHRARWIVVLSWTALFPGLVAQMAWTPTSPATRPNARYDHALVYDAARSRIVLFGGRQLFAPILDDTWEWSGSDWVQRAPASHPSARGAHAMAFDIDRGVVVLFGGRDAGYQPLGDTWEWDGNGWTSRTPAHAPPPLHSTGLAYDAARRRTLLFGGHDGTASRDDTWEWNGSDWTLRPASPRPAPMTAPGLAFDAARQVVVLFGGAGLETWEWNGLGWAQRSPASSPTGSSTVCYDATRQRIVMYLPWTFPAPQTWEYDGRDWRLTVGTGPAPSHRDSIAMAHDVARGRTVAFGGWYFHAAMTFDDTWEYAPTTTGTVSQVGTGCAGSLGVPWAAAVGPPIVGNRDFAVQIAPAPPGTPAWIVVSTQPARRLVSGGCLVFVEPPLLSAAGIGSASGQVTIGVALPAVPALSGLVFHAQGVVADGGGAYQGIAAFTQGLTIRIGD